MNSSRRQLQLFFSSVGALLIVPWGLFMGVMFTFSFRENESPWVWGFDALTFWSQIAAILFSFLKPRLAAFWMLANIVASLSIGIGFEVQSFLAPGARHLGTPDWAAFLPALAYDCAVFWGLPAAFAVMLLMAEGVLKFSDRNPSPLTSTPQKRDHDYSHRT